MSRKNILFLAKIMILLTLTVMLQESAGAGANGVPQIFFMPVGSYDTPGIARCVALAGDYTYVADGVYGLRIINIRNPAHPTEVAAFGQTLQNAQDVVVMGGTAYVADGLGGLKVIDISDPTNPSAAGWYPTTYAASKLVVSGQYAYVVSGFSLEIFDLAHPAGSPAVANYRSGNVVGLDVVGNYAYVTVFEAGGTPGSGSRCGYHSECSYLEVVNVTDPSSPQRESYEYLASAILSLPAYKTLSALHVAGSHAYVGNGAHGFAVVDVSDPTNPSQTGYYGDIDALAVHVDGPHAHLAVAEDGLRVINVSNPAAPTAVGHYYTQGTTSDVTVDGTTVYLADGEGGLVILSQKLVYQRLFMPIASKENF